MAIERKKNKLGQYFTPAEICNFMVGLSSQGNQVRVLEPSSGEGAFLDALSEAGYSNVIGVELDSEIAHHARFPVICSSFITWDSNEKFDLVIGNPPYIRWKDLEQEQKDEIKNHRFFGNLVNSLSDYLLPFIALSIEKLNDGGELIFITPSFWLQTKHSKSIRDFLSSHGTVTDLVDFGETTIFKGVATSLIVFKFVKNQNALATTLHRFVGKSNSLSALDLTDPAQFRSETISHFQVKDKFVPAFDDEVEIPIKLERACLKSDQLLPQSDYFELGSFVRIANGMVTGLDAAFRLSDAQAGEIPEVEMEGISKVAKGRNLSYLYSPKFSYYIDIDPTLTWDTVSARFPTLISHLETFRPELEKRYNYADGAAWWHWSFYRSSSFLRSEAKKGFVPGKERLTHKAHVRFTLCSPGAIATQDVAAFAPHAETRESIEYIVAYLNRSAVSQWVKAFGLMKGGVAEFSEKPLSEIPFKAINWADPEEVQVHEQITRTMNLLELEELKTELAEEELRKLFSKLLPSELSF